MDIQHTTCRDWLGAVVTCRRAGDEITQDDREEEQRIGFQAGEAWHYITVEDADGTLPEDPAAHDRMCSPSGRAELLLLLQRGS
jgi:hypothetical protein